MRTESITDSKFVVEAAMFAMRFEVRMREVPEDGTKCSKERRLKYFSSPQHTDRVHDGLVVQISEGGPDDKRHDPPPIPIFQRVDVER